MNITAIIAEFNPFHAGHRFLLQKQKEMTDADYCIVIMSGNYVQRGEAALFEKDLRVRAALLNGADLVLELPVPFACASAEYFASAAVSILNGLGCVTHLAFGTESGDLAILQKVSALLREETPEFRSLLQDFLRQGCSFPAAREKAILALYSDLFPAPDVLHATLQNPNNVLALEYLNALGRTHSSITPVTIRRMGMGYHDVSAPCDSALPLDSALPFYASASAIRQHILQEPSSEAPASYASLLSYLQQPDVIPGNMLSLYEQAITAHRYVSPDDLSMPLAHALCFLSKEELLCYQDVTPDLADKILNLRDRFVSYDQFIQALKSRDMTYSRISRTLLHILLQLRKDQVALRKEHAYGTYCSVLGFREDHAAVLSEIKKHSSLPLLTRYADAKRLLSPEFLLWYEQDLRADAFYQTLLTHSARKNPSGLAAATQKPAIHDQVYSRQIIKL